MAVNEQQLHQLYLAYFGRPPDWGGLQYYLTQGDATVQAVASAFSASPESQGLYGASFNAAQIDAFYMNSFNRHAEPDAQTYWTQEVQSGRLSPAMAAWGILIGAQNDDKQTVNNKMTASRAWVDKMVGNPALQRGYAGVGGANIARNLIHRVYWSDPSLAQVQWQIELTLWVAEQLNRAPVTNQVDWEYLGGLPGITSDQNYTPIVHTTNGLEVFSNFSPEGLPVGHLYRFEGTLAGVGPSEHVLSTPAGPDAFLRTLSVVRGEVTGHYYGLLYTGDAYPGTNGYSPSMAFSDDGKGWVWAGSVTPYRRTLASAGAMVVDEARFDGERFMAWIDTVGTGLNLMTSANGVTWNDQGNVWPMTQLPDDAADPLWATVCKTPHGYHMITAKEWPAQQHRHLFSTDGRKWRVLEQDIAAMPIGNVTKGAHLAYNPKDGYVYALGAGQLYRFLAKPF